MSTGAEAPTNVKSLAASGPTGELEVLNLEGGQGGTAFDDIGQIVTAVATAGRLAQVNVWHAEYVDAIQLVYSIGNTLVSTPKHGGSGGNLDTFTLQPGEYITSIQGRAADYVDRLQFFTNKGQTYTYGGTGGTAFEWTPDPSLSMGLAWFSGRCSEYVDQLTPYFVAQK